MYLQCWGVSWYVFWYKKTYQVSSIMIHFWCSISISITDTLWVYQYHKSLIHDCDIFKTDDKKKTAAVNCLFRVSTTVSRIRIPHMLPRDKSWSWRRFLWLQHNTINWLSSQCCQQGMYQLLEWHWHWTENAGKIQSNLESFHHIQHNSGPTIVWSSALVERLCFSTAGQIEVNHQSSEWLDVWDTFATESKP